MKTMRKLAHRQRGMSSFGWIAVAGIFGLLIISFFKVFPMYMEFMSVRSVLESVQNDPKIDPKSKKAIWESIQKKMYINEVKSVKRENVTIKREDGKTIVTVSYETRRPYIANLFIGGNFTETVVINR